MAPISEKQAIEEQLKEIQSLVSQRDKIQARITKLGTSVRALADLLDDSGEQRRFLAILDIVSKPIGLTEAIKNVMRNSGRLTAMAVRDKLTESHFPMSSYSNPLGAVYTTLARLQDQGFINKPTATEYEWGTPKTIEDAVRNIREADEVLRKLGERRIKHRQES
jgi:hypothetical protein